MRVQELLKRSTVVLVVLSFTLVLPVGSGMAMGGEFETAHEQLEYSGFPLWQSGSQSGKWEYSTQSGDTIEVIASRFQVGLDAVDLDPGVPVNQLLDPGQRVTIDRRRSGSALVKNLLPDFEVVYSPSVKDFSVQDYIADADGFLNDHKEYLRSTGLTPAAEIIERVAIENSFHPRLLLALLEYQCGCVTGPLNPGADSENLMKIQDPSRRGLYRQLGWTVNQLSLGYYGWRQGLIHDLVLFDGGVVSLPPDINAGSAALAYLFSRLEEREGWVRAVGSEQGFTKTHQDLFPDTWQAGYGSQELFPPGLFQPEMILPFEIDQEWSFTSGPHPAWETESANAALDFAPASERFGCEPSTAWVLAAADGMVVRSEHNALVIDLDGDGDEGTGWALLYMHLADYQRAPEGVFLEAGSPIGHPSCEGGPADGTHVHLARKFNGEWIAAGGPLPFVMSGWVAQAGYRPYDGSLVRGNQIVQANPLSPAAAFISRLSEDLRSDLAVSQDLWWEEFGD